MNVEVSTNVGTNDLLPVRTPIAGARHSRRSALVSADARVLAEISQLQASIEHEKNNLSELEKELKEQLHAEGEDLCDVDEALKDTRERLSVLLAAGRGESNKARRLTAGIEALEIICSTRYKMDTVAKVIEAKEKDFEQKMKSFLQQDVSSSSKRRSLRAASMALSPTGKFVSNRTKHEPKAGRPPYTAKETQSVIGNELICCCSSMQGMRPTQEDEHLMRASLPFAKQFAFFAVFDGHGGQATARRCEKHFLRYLHGATDWTKPVSPDDIGKVLVTAYMNFDSWLKQRPEKEHETSGATALSALISPTHIVIANLGECRAVLVRGGKVIQMSNEHKPKDKTEYKRIKAAGGGVIMGRVMGELAVARAFGDFSLKDSDELPPEKQMVSCEPDTRTIERGPDDNFLVLACDGVWDVMSNEECVKFIRDGLDRDEELQNIINDLLDHCLKKRSRDNMTCMVVDFQPYSLE